MVRALVDTLRESDIIIHMEMSRHLPAGIGGTTRFVARRGGHRYVRMTISTQLSADARVAMLGHELQHALEIAQSQAHDVAALRLFWERQGYHVNGAYFETATALRVERSVRRELR
jgi:hypothetical protein